MRLVVVDNYDSFTWNLVELFERLGARCEVVLNDACDADAIAAREADAFVVSPGPCTPAESGASLPLVRRATQGHLGRPLLGVCLGHQALAAALGGDVVRAERPLHGKTSRVSHDGLPPFDAVSQGFEAARYNSLVVDRATLPGALCVAAWSEAGEILALRHRALPLLGLQFHPESFLTPEGPALIAAWLRGVARVV